MARFVTITNSNSNRLGRRKRTITKQTKIGLATLAFLLGSIICISSVMYIFQVNKVATMGYEIRNKEKQIFDLKKDNERLKLDAARLKSINNIEAETAQKDMKKPTQVSYIEVENPVAMK